MMSNRVVLIAPPLLMASRRVLSTARFSLNRKIISHQVRVKTNLMKLAKKGGGKSKRNYMSPQGSKSEMVNSSSFYNTFDGSIERTINPNVLHREQKVAALLIVEMNDMISSGAFGTELYYEGVIITDIVHQNKGNAHVMWHTLAADSHEEVRDDLQEKMCALSSAFRAGLINCNIVGQVPKLHMRYDEERKDTARLDDLFEGLPAAERCVKGEAADEDMKAVTQQLEKTFKSELDDDTTHRRELSEDMFRVNQSELTERLKHMKAMMGRHKH